MSAQDRAAVREYYDRFGDAETERLTATVAGRVSLEVHRRFLGRFLRPGMRVLEVGAGPGRFTTELASLGARVVVTDLSPVQLELNRRHVGATAAEEAVERRELLDVCNVSRYRDAEFDLVLAYGGVLSYAFEETENALRGLLRVSRAQVVASVMSTVGTWRAVLPGVVRVATEHGEAVNDAVLRTGDLRHVPGAAHVCRMFRSRELRDLAERCGALVAAMSASNWASLGDAPALATLEADPDRWARFLDHEVSACAEPGALDGGTHLLLALQHGDRLTGE